MNIFSNLKVYPGKWIEKEARKFTADEVAAIQTAKVVESKYGASICFIMKAGGECFIPCDANSSYAIGSVIDPTKVEVVTLSREGEEDIYRIR